MAEPSIAEQIAWLRAYVGDDTHFKTPAWVQRRGLLREILGTLEAHEPAMAVVRAAEDLGMAMNNCYPCDEEFKALWSALDAALPPPADAPETERSE